QLIQLLALRRVDPYEAVSQIRSVVIFTITPCPVVGETPFKVLGHEALRISKHRLHVAHGCKGQEEEIAGRILLSREVERQQKGFPFCRSEVVHQGSAHPLDSQRRPTVSHEAGNHTGRINLGTVHHNTADATVFRRGKLQVVGVQTSHIRRVRTKEEASPSVTKLLHRWGGRVLVVVPERNSDSLPKDASIATSRL